MNHQQIPFLAALLFSAFSIHPCLAQAGDAPHLETKYGKLSILPADSPWNQKVTKLKVHPKSDAFVASIGADKPLHPDFGTEWNGAPNGIPFVVVRGDQKKVPVKFQYADESDKGPYPIPPDAPIEGGPNGKGDRHIIVLDYDNKKLYEVFSAHKDGKGWRCGSGAIFDLNKKAERPVGWTSADAAGLPIFPGLVRYDEVERGEIRHALRFTVRKSQKAYIPPATHYASKHVDPNLPPMGLRFRLKEDFDISKFPPQAKIVAQALKTYGMIVADNGGDWFISGAPNEKWDNDDLRWLKKIKGSDLEAVFTGETFTKYQRRGR